MPLKFGGELRVNSSASARAGPGLFWNPDFASTHFGRLPNTTTLVPGKQVPSLATYLRQTRPCPWLLAETTTVKRKTSLVSFFAGSWATSSIVSSDQPDQVGSSTSGNVDEHPPRRSSFQSKFMQKEFNAFLKDNWKISRILRCTLAFAGTTRGFRTSVPG